MRFIDLFAGLGGFHIALSDLGHECVFASELKPSLISLYESNFNFKPVGDIKKINEKDIPPFDILCAGFPCQPFSKAGMQKGMNDTTNGDLFQEIVRILKYHNSKYFILENVQHLAKHDNEETYKNISNILEELGYAIEGNILSPHEFNIPQHRQRLFIVGCKDGLDHFKWPQKVKLRKSALSYLDKNPKFIIPLEKEKVDCLNIWQEFLDRIPLNEKLPSFPIWAMEFQATYPFETSTPNIMSSSYLGRFRGSFGIPLKGLSMEDKIKNLPSYSRVEDSTFPTWKKHFIRSNRAFYLKHAKELKPVIKKIHDLDVSSWQKFEWNIQGGERCLENYIIQFRGSGIRIKRSDFFPSLVTVSTQIPIIGWQKRYITKQEGAKLQGLDKLNSLPENVGTCFDALGNAVNGHIVKLIAKELLK